MTIELTDEERRMTAIALEAWLAMYSFGVKPQGYEDAASAVKKLEAK